MVRLTVFTPAYNRSNTIMRTYESLLDQSCKDFIWLIVDDGSSDNTEEIVRNWQLKNNGFQIKYIYKENGGMHTAHNVAYENIETELNVCIDSDDMMGKDAVKKILDYWDKVKDKGYAGIIGLDADFNGNVIGRGFESELYETTLQDYYSNGGQGDKKLVYQTDIIKAFPEYPVFESERYVALAYKYRLIDQSYKLAVLNEVLCNVEYQADGSSQNMLYQYKKNPCGFAFWRKVCMEYPMSTNRVFIECIHYVSSSLLSKNKYFIKESPKKLQTILALPFGIALYIYINVKIKG